MAITVRIVDNSGAFMQRTMAQVGMGVEAAAEALAAAMKNTLSSRGGAGGGLGSGAGGAMPSNPGSPPAYQRGGLHRSIRSTKAQIIGNRASAYAGTSLRYGASLEHGFTATAKGGALLVPLQPEAHRLLERNLVRNNPQLFMVRRPGKPPLLARRGPRGSIVPLFVLKKSVTVKPRPWLRPSLDRARPAMAAAFIRAASVGRNAA
jgi:hypothetical protein